MKILWVRFKCCFFVLFVDIINKIDISILYIYKIVIKCKVKEENYYFLNGVYLEG